MGELERVTGIQADLGEGPVWDERAGILYWIDILAGLIHQYTPASGQMATHPLGQPIGCLVLREHGGLLCALQDGIYSFDPEQGKLARLLARPDAELADNRFNDGKCDPVGRFFAGTMSNAGNEGHGESQPAGTLFRISPDWQVQAMVRPVAISNGLAWSSDQKTMYYIDSPTRLVSAFDYDESTGNLANRRTVIDFTAEDGIPDGMTIDAADRLWIAHWGGWKLSCWHPATGRKLDEIPLPCQNVTCCAFGGDSYDDLYITTARIGLDPSALAAQPDAGALFCIRTGARGLPPDRFKG